MPKDSRLYLVILAFLVAGIVTGFFIGKNQTPGMNKVTTNAQDDSLFSSQSASIFGRINNVRQNEISVTNSASNVSGTIPLSERVIITTLEGKPPTSDASVLEPGKDVSIQLEKIDGEYQAVTIQYTTPAPSLPPVMPKATTNP